MAVLAKRCYRCSKLRLQTHSSLLRFAVVYLERAA